MRSPHLPRCTAVTTLGQPCQLAARPDSDVCGWHDPARQVRRAELASTTDRTCVRCKVTQPPDHYYPSGHGNGRRRVCIRCIKAENAAKAGYRRHPRYNGRGEVWCNNCKRYRTADHFKRHPLRPHTYWSYCQECTRELDRLRWCGERRKRNNETRLVRQARDQANRRRERQVFVARAIETINRRGFTVSEIARLAGVSLTNLYAWRAKRTRVTTAVEARFAIVLQATGHLPIGKPAFRRRTPHPEFATIQARIAPELAAHPTRNNWSKGNRDHQRKDRRKEGATP